MDDEIIEYILSHPEYFEEEIDFLERMCSEDEIEEVYKIQHEMSKSIQDS